MKEEEEKKSKKEIVLLSIVLVAIISLMIFLNYEPEELTPKPILNDSKLYMEMEYYYYDLDQLIDYADEQGVGTDEEITEEMLQECIDVGYCEKILKEGLPIAD